ncbi:unnamed protein product, partial [Symbiodinium sp. CCMP2592]
LRSPAAPGRLESENTRFAPGACWCSISGRSAEGAIICIWRCGRSRPVTILVLRVSVFKQPERRAA